MIVARMRRGWRVRLTDNEMELLREIVHRGLGTLDEGAIASLPYKVRKVLADKERWSWPPGPLIADEDRRPA